MASRLSAVLVLVLVACCGDASAEVLTWQEANRRSAAAIERNDRKQAAEYARQAFDLYEVQSRNYTIANHAQLLLNLLAARRGTTYLKTLLKEFELAIGHMRRKASRPDPAFVELWKEGARLAMTGLETRIAHEHYSAAAAEADELWGEGDPRAIVIHSMWANDLRQSRDYSWAKAKLTDARERAATSDDPLLLFAVDLNLGRLEIEAGKHEAAIPIYRSLVERAEAKPEAVPKSTLQALYSQLEFSYEEVGDSEAAKAMRERLIATFDGAAQQDLKAIFRVMPDYPVRAGGGSVTLRVWVKADGSVRDVTVVSSSDSLFDQPCLDAVRRWKFLPRTIDGQPVEQDGIVRLYFSRKTNYWSG